jgi:tetratricopeptide (TPR) repeat protein
MENYTKAIEDYNFILSSQIDIKTLINRAFCFAKINQYEKSIMDYSKILEIENKNIHALYNRALSYEKSNKFKEVMLNLHRLFKTLVS